MSAPSGQQRFSVPRENGATLILPPLDESGALLEKNLRIHRAANVSLNGRSLADLSRQARKELLEAAISWTSSYRPVEMPSVDPEGPIFLAGHQPELFHPGVWFKNFALSELGRRHRAAAVNLVIDSDVLKRTSLVVPCGTPADPRREAVLFDRPDVRIPFEERPILDECLFCNFGRRVAQRMAALVPDPLVGRYWPLVCARSRHVNRLGYCLAQARHQLEGKWGLETLEVPQSAVCDGEAFRWFVAHLIAHAARFRDAYNGAVQEYRHANGIRNAAHPATDLVADAEWIEAPLWMWTADRPQRRRVFVGRRGAEILVSDREGEEIRLSLRGDDDATDAAGQLTEWSRRGVKIRSRALVTTLWARLALSDVFLHGIGGAKYDQVTDHLMESFFGLAPPDIMVLSATLYLPIPRPQAPGESLRAIRRELRDLSFHPEKFLGDSGALEADSQAAELIAEKRRWIDVPLTHDNAYARWKAIDRINSELEPRVAARRQQLLDQQTQTERAARHDKVLGSREYGFCLFPEKYLRDAIKTGLDGEHAPPQDRSS